MMKLTREEGFAANPLLPGMISNVGAGGALPIPGLGNFPMNPTGVQMPLGLSLALPILNPPI